MSDIIKSKVSSIRKILDEHRKIYKNLVPFNPEKQTTKEYKKASMQFKNIMKNVIFGKIRSHPKFTKK